MKGLPIPKRHSMLQSATPEIRLKQLEDQMNAVVRNVESLSKPFVDARNMHLESIEIRHFSEECYGDEDDLTNLRFGDDEDAGTSLGPFAPADHKHALDPVLILERSDPTQLTANTNNWALDEDYSNFYVDADAARNVTGIDGGVDGRFIFLHNDGSFDITLKHQDALSDADNRFLFSTGLDIILGGGDSIELVYDSVTARWRDGAGTSISPTGSGVANQMTYWTSATTIGGDPGFTYNATQNRATIDGTDNARLTLQSNHNTTQTSVEITNAGTGDTTITFDDAEVWTIGSDQSTARFAIANASTLGTGADMLRITNDGAWTYVGQAVSTGAADEFTHHDFNIAGGTITFTTDVTLATQRAVRFRKPTYAADAATQTITDAATVYIENAPAAGTNVTLTNAYALWVDDGVCRFDGSVGIGTSGPDAKLDVLSTSTQLRLTYTDGSVYGNFTVEATGKLTLSTTGTEISWEQTAAAAALEWKVYNAATDGAARMMVQVNGASAGDPYQAFDLNTGVSWSVGIRNSDSDKFMICNSFGLSSNQYITITTAGLVTTGVGGFIGNEAGADVDFRWESDDEAYCLMVEGTLNNIVMCANAEPGFNSMDGGVFLAEANVVPTGNPTAGIYIYVEGGAGKARGTGGTITTWAPAEPHCEVCGTDYGHEWENTRWGRLQFCVNCLADDVAKRNGGELPKWIKRERIGA